MKSSQGCPTGSSSIHKTGDLMAYFSNDMDAIRMAVGSGHSDYL